MADGDGTRADCEGIRAFITGWPVEHSRSPLIHNFWLRKFGLAGSYERVAVEPAAIGGFLGALRQNGFAGGNVTIPHKEAAFQAAERHEAAAAAIGAVNTVWLEDGRLTGGNTDAYGFAANLDERLAGWDDGEVAVVLGAGGAARAVVHALIDRGFKRVRIVNRTVPRAEALAAVFGPAASVHGADAAGECMAGADLLVNTVPPPKIAGGTMDLDLAALPDHAMVTDIVYVPLETPCLAAANARGLRTADGLGMLLHQAVPGFERWFGRRPAVSEDLRALVLRDIEAAA